MSTDLSEQKFTDSAQQGAFSWLFEGFRTRMRDTAKAVRMEAAWQTWPTLHKISKALQERLTTPADVEAQRQEWVQAFLERCEKCYPTPDFIGDINDPERRKVIASDLGLSDDFDDPKAEFQLNEILALYESRNGKIPMAETVNPSHEIS